MLGGYSFLNVKKKNQRPKAWGKGRLWNQRCGQANTEVDIIIFTSLFPLARQGGTRLPLDFSLHARIAGLARTPGDTEPMIL